MKQLYKVGDSVLVKDKYDPGYNEYGYTYCFTQDMLIQYGGKVCTISMVQYDPNLRGPGRIPDDDYLYYLEEDNAEWSWASSMFEPEF